MAKQYNFKDKELELIQSSSWDADTGVQPLETPYSFDETLGDYIRVSIFDDTNFSNRFITSFDSNDQEILDKLASENLQFIYRDANRKIFIKVNELLRIANLDTNKYSVRFDFLRSVFSDVYLGPENYTINSDLKEVSPNSNSIINWTVESGDLHTEISDTNDWATTSRTQDTVNGNTDNVTTFNISDSAGSIYQELSQLQSLLPENALIAGKKYRFTALFKSTDFAVPGPSFPGTNQMVKIAYRNSSWPFNFSVSTSDDSTTLSITNLANALTVSKNTGQYQRAYVDFKIPDKLHYDKIADTVVSDNMAVIDGMQQTHNFYDMSNPSGTTPGNRIFVLTNSIVANELGMTLGAGGCSAEGNYIGRSQIVDIAEQGDIVCDIDGIYFASDQKDQGRIEVFSNTLLNTLNPTNNPEQVNHEPFSLNITNVQLTPGWYNREYTETPHNSPTLNTQAGFEELEKNPKFIVKEISNSRKEVRLIVRNDADDFLFSNAVRQEFEKIMGTLNDENYGFDYVLNFEESVSIPVNNYAFDMISEPNANKETGELVSLILRLNQPLPTQIELLDEIKLEKEIITTHTQKVYYISDSTTGFKTNGLTIDETYPVNNDLSEQNFELESYIDLFESSSITNETKRNLFSASLNIDNINIDYSEFKNHTTYGSAAEKLQNFYNKVSTLEDYYTELSSSLLQNENKAFDIEQELVVNGQFSGSITGWNQSAQPYDTLEWSSVSQSLHAVSDGSAGGDTYNSFSSDDNIALVAGRKYRYQFKLSQTSGTNPEIRLRAASLGTVRHTFPIEYANGKLNQGVFWATTTENVVFEVLNESDEAADFYLDNVSIAEIYAEKASSDVINRRQVLFEKISEVTENFTPYEKFLFYDGQSVNTSSAPGLGPNLASINGSVPFAIDNQVSTLTELYNYDGFNKKVYKIDDKNSDDKYVQIFQQKYSIHDKPFFNYDDAVYISFLYKGDETLDWYNSLSNSNNATWGTFPEPLPQGAYHSEILESQNNTTASKWHRCIIKASQSYWRPAEGYSVGGADNPITDWTANSSQIELLNRTSATGSYPIELFGNYSGIGSEVVESGTPFTGSVMPAGELFHFGWITGSVAVTSSYITDVKITTTNPTNTLPFVNTFLTSSTEFDDWYTSISASAVTYDYGNWDSLFKNLPVVYQDHPDKEVLYKFVSLVGEFFDTQKHLIKTQDSFRKRDYNTLNSPPVNLIPDFTDAMGWELISPFTGSLAGYFGTDESDILVDGNTIKDIESNTYRKLLNNLIYIYKSKGTANATRALTNIFGYPADVLSVREGGGSLEEHNPTIISNQVTNLLDGLENTEGNISFQKTRKELLSYVFVNSGSSENRNILELPWHVDSAYPECIEFIFKAPKSINNQKILESSGSDYNNWNIKLLQSGSDPSGSSYGRLQFNLNNSAQAASDISSNSVNVTTPFVELKNNKPWNVMISRSIPTGSTHNVTQSYQLSVALQDKDKITNFVTASLVVSNSNANTNFTASNLTAGSTGNLEFGRTFTGSISEIRAWDEKLNISKFKQHILNKFSTVGNHLSSSQQNLIYHFKLNEGYKATTAESSSLKFYDAAPKNIKDYSFSKTGAQVFYSSSLFDRTMVDAYSFAIRAGGLNEINDKKIITSPVTKIVKPLSATESSELVLDNDTEPIRQYSNNLYLTRTPQATLNDYIIDKIADSDISDYFGNPEDLTKAEYSELNNLRKQILDDTGVTVDINKWIKAQKGIFSEAFVEAIKSSIPAKAKLSDIGIMLEPTILERNKIKNPVLSNEILGLSGSCDQIQYYDFSDSRKVFSKDTTLNSTEKITFGSSSYEPVREPKTPLNVVTSTYLTTGVKETLFGDKSLLDVNSEIRFDNSIIEKATKVNISDNVVPSMTAIGDADEGLKSSSNPMKFNNLNNPLFISESRELLGTYESIKTSNNLQVLDTTLVSNINTPKTGSYDLVGNTTVNGERLTSTDIVLDGNVVGGVDPDLSKKWGRTIDDVHFVNYAGGTGSAHQHWYVDTFNNTGYYESQFYFQMIGDYEIMSSSKYDNSEVHTEFENQKFFLNRQLMVQGIHKGKEIGHTRHLPTGSDGDINYPSNHITRNPDPFHMRMIDGNQHVGSKFFNVTDKDDLSTASFYRVKVTGDNKLIVNRNKRISDDDGNVSNLR